jgi:hypothetical protein
MAQEVEHLPSKCGALSSTPILEEKISWNNSTNKTNTAILDHNPKYEIKT